MQNIEELKSRLLDTIEQFYSSDYLVVRAEFQREQFSDALTQVVELIERETA